MQFFKTSLIAVILVSSFVSCDRHKMQSHVDEKEVTQNQTLTATEDIHKAYLENDYQALDQFVNEQNIDQVIFEGRNLLALAVEDENIEMMAHLVEKGANAQVAFNNASEEQNEMSIEDYVLTNYSEPHREIYLKVLRGKLDLVSSHLFYQAIEASVQGAGLSVRWLKKLFVAGVDLGAIDEKMLVKVFALKIYPLGDAAVIYGLIFENLPLELGVQWTQWLEKPFVQGRYRRAQCQLGTTIIKEYSEFLNTCNTKFRKKLEKAESKIWPILFLRNYLLEI